MFEIILFNVCASIAMKIYRCDHRDTGHKDKGGHPTDVPSNCKSSTAAIQPVGLPIIRKQICRSLKEKNEETQQVTKIKYLQTNHISAFEMLFAFLFSGVNIRYYLNL